MVSYLPLLLTKFIQEAWTAIINETTITPETNTFIKFINELWIPLSNILSCASERHHTTNLVEKVHHRINARFVKKTAFFSIYFYLKRKVCHQDYKIMKSYFDLPKENRRNKEDSKITHLVYDVDEGKISPIQTIKSHHCLFFFFFKLYCH